MSSARIGVTASRDTTSLFRVVAMWMPLSPSATSQTQPAPMSPSAASVSSFRNASMEP